MHVIRVKVVGGYQDFFVYGAFHNGYTWLRATP